MRKKIALCVDSEGLKGRKVHCSVNFCDFSRCDRQEHKTLIYTFIELDAYYYFVRNFQSVFFAI